MNTTGSILNTYYDESFISDSNDFFCQEASFINEYRPFISEETDTLIDSLERSIQESNMIDSITTKIDIIDESFSLKGIIDTIKKAILTLWGKIKEFFGKIFRGIKNILNGHAKFLKEVTDFKGFMRNKKSGGSVSEDAIFMSIFGEDSIFTEDGTDSDDIDANIAKTKEIIKDIKSKIDNPTFAKQKDSLNVALANKERALENLEKEKAEQDKKNKHKPKPKNDDVPKEENKDKPKDDKNKSEEDKKLEKKLNKAGKALKDEDVMFATVDSNNRTDACMKELYESDPFLHTDKLFSTFDLIDADDKISDSQEASTAARTAKLFNFKLKDGETAGQYITNFVTSTYYKKTSKSFPEENGKPTAIKYFDLVKKAQDIADQFIALNHFMNGTFYNNMTKTADKYEHWYNNYLRKLEQDYIKYQSLADKKLNDRDKDRFDTSYLTRRDKDKDGKDVATDKINEDDIRRVRKKLQTLQSICSNHVAFIRIHATTLTNCATQEYRMLRHALILMMNYEGFYKNNNGKEGVYSRLSTDVI